MVSSYDTNSFVYFYTSLVTHYRFPSLLPFVILASDLMKKHMPSHLSTLCLSMPILQDRKVFRAMKVESVRINSGYRTPPWFTVPVILWRIQPAEFDELPCAYGLFMI